MSIDSEISKNIMREKRFSTEQQEDYFRIQSERLAKATLADELYHAKMQIVALKILVILVAGIAAITIILREI
jgi:hypothetical protein